MPKLGKYSKGSSKQPQMSSYGGKGNDGYSKKTNMMGANGLKKHEAETLNGRHTATGKKVMVKTKNVKRKM